MGSIIPLTTAVSSLADRLATTVSFSSTRIGPSDDKVYLLIGHLKSLSCAVAEIAKIPTNQLDLIRQDILATLENTLETTEQLLLRLEAELGGLSSSTSTGWSLAQKIARIPVKMNKSLIEDYVKHIQSMTSALGLLFAALQWSESLFFRSAVSNSL